MSVSVTDVKNLNSKIENINLQRTKAETRVEMLKKQLDNELADYESLFGVSLKDKKFAVVKAKVKQELDKVNGIIVKEYELKEKVVNAIERSDFQTAYDLLGIRKEQPEEVEEDVSESLFDDNAEDDNSVESGSPVMLDEIAQEPVTKSVKVNTMPVVEDDDDDDILLPNMNSSVAKSKSSTGSDVTKVTINSKSKEKKNVVNAFNNMIVEEEEGGGFDFGFDNILSGSKFLD